MKSVGRASLLSAVLPLAGCSAALLGGSVEILAKLGGWRDGPGYEGPFAALEIATVIRRR